MNTNKFFNISLSVILLNFLKINSKKTVALFVSGFLPFTLYFVLFWGCAKEEDPKDNSFALESGVLIINEGQFNKSNASVLHYNIASQDTNGHLFSRANNGVLLGDVLQSATIIADNVWLVVSNSQKIETVNKKTFKSTGTITGLSLPRHAIDLGNGKVAVSDYKSYTTTGEVVIVNVNDLSIEKRITVGNLPENMAISNGKLFVVNSNDSTCSVIDIATLSVINTIVVGDRPNSIKKTTSGQIIVLCGGVPSFQGSPTPGSLVKIDAASDTVSVVFPFTDPNTHPSKLYLNTQSQTGYFIYGGNICAFNTSNLNGGYSPIISTLAYGLAIHPDSSEIYVADAGNFTSNGVVYIFDEQTYMAKDTVAAGIAPKGFVFY